MATFGAPIDAQACGKNETFYPKSYLPTVICWPATKRTMPLKPAILQPVPVFALLLLLCPALCFAQLSIESVQNLSLKDGLSDRAVLDILQDSDGFLWIATNNGLNRYDGYRFMVFDNNENTEHRIGHSRIHRMEELRGGQLGLLNLSDLSFFEVLDLHSLQSEQIGLGEENGVTGNCKTIFFEKKGRVFVLSSSEGAYHISRSDDDHGFQLQASVPCDSALESKILGFQVSPAGHCWILDDHNGLLKIDGKGKVLHHWPAEKLLAQTRPTDVTYEFSLLHEDSAGKLWLSVPKSQGILNIPPNDTTLIFPEKLPQDEVYSEIWEDDDGQITLGTHLSYGKLKQLFSVKKNGAVEDLSNLLDIELTVSEVFRPAHENILLLGTFVGIFKVDLTDRAVSWLLADQQLADNQWEEGISIRGITGDGQGNIFISRELTAWYQSNEQLRPAEEIVLRNESGHKIELWCCSNVVWDGNGHLWGGSCTHDRDGLLHRYHLLDKTTRTFDSGGKTIRHLIKLENGQLLLVTGTFETKGRMFFFDPKTTTFTEYRDADGKNPLAALEPQFVLEARNGHLWTGTTKGLLWIDPAARISKLYQRDSSQLTNDDITAIHETAAGKLLLGTHGGLNIFDPTTGKVRAYTTHHGLSNNIIAGVVPDGEKGYWMPTYYGLSHFDPATGLFSTFYQKKGLTFNEFNRLAHYRDREGKFYFGTINGINVFKNEDLKKAPFDNMRPQWTRISVYHGGVERTVQETGFDDLRSISLKPGDELVRFNFCLPVFENVQGNRFAVMLEGRDTAWQYLGNRPFFELNNPPPGNFTLRVKAAPSNGMWGEEELSVQLHVAEAFYLTTWFWIALPLALLLLSYLGSKWYISRIRRKEVEQTRINKKFAELELEALQAQMNPHFVFNSLGAIQYFIQNHNTQAADAYLGKFAKLMRLFLESSKNKYISLAEEIKLLSLYIELEQMRFEDKFDWDIFLDDEIDAHTREIPSILIQPFVENAINHGLFNKQTKGILQVNFRLGKKDTLVCTVLDNGVGRENAENIKQDGSRHYKSRGMQIVRERLEVLQEVDDVKIHVHIENLNPTLPDPGTKVTLEIENID